MTEAEGEDQFGRTVVPAPAAEPPAEETAAGDAAEAAEDVAASADPLSAETVTGETAGDVEATRPEAVAPVSTEAADQPHDEPGPAQHEAMPTAPPTGDRRVDEAVTPLHDLANRPTDEHVAVYEAAHAGLTDVLADLDRDSDAD